MRPDWVAEAAARLRAEGIPDALREADRIAAIAVPGRGLMPDPDQWDGAARNRFDDLVSRRLAREPLSHLLGYRDFYKHRFVVSADVLDPRPDTETLVDVALSQGFSEVLDLGTGSGCILLSLLAERPQAIGTGTDLSSAALAVAAQNAKGLGLAQRVRLLVSDWFENVRGHFDLIVSNPPYIALDEMAQLQPEVRLHEPRMALTDEGDGLSAYRSIIAGHAPHLTAGGRLLVEIGPSQAQAVSQLMADAGLSNVAVKTDIDGRDRVVIGQNAG